MPSVTETESFPKSIFSRADVEAERTLRLAIPGAISCTISDDDDNWILTTVLPGGDDAPEPAPPPVAPQPPQPLPAVPQPPPAVPQPLPAVPQPPPAVPQPPPAVPQPPPAVPQPRPVAPQPPPLAPGTIFVLGGLSEKFESGGRGPTTISGGVGDPGGVSYGTYQMKSQPNGGSVKTFVNQPDFPWRAEFAGLTPGLPAFSAKWREIAGHAPTVFRNAERAFIKQTYYDPFCRRMAEVDGVDVAQLSHALQDVIWSTALQHGPNANIVHLAFNQMRAARTFDPAAPGFDRNAIIAIYAERGRKDANGGLVHFPHSSRAVQLSVARRFVEEQADALKMLDAGV